jgi:hypothetical protein
MGDKQMAGFRSWKPWQRWLAVGGGSIFALGCIGAMLNPNAALPVDARNDVAQARPGPIELEFKTVALTTYAAVIPGDADPEALDRAARAHCAGKDYCTVIGWVDPDKVATGFPMTDREAAAVKFQYDLNRNSGFERSLFACSTFKDLSAEKCISEMIEQEHKNASVEAGE